MKPAQKAIQLINELPESKVKVAVDFLEFLKSREGFDLEDANESIKEGIRQVAMIRSGKLKGRPVEDLFDGL